MEIFLKVNDETETFIVLNRKMAFFEPENDPL